MPAERKHTITVIVDGKKISGWLSYRIESSMITPADAFTLKRPWSADVWNAIPMDSRVRVMIDSVVVLDGFVDRRMKATRDGTLEISGRDRSGRLVQESAPSINYEGLKLSEALKRLADPWFTKITFSDARNRSSRRGVGRRVSSGKEPTIVDQRVPRVGKIHPGQPRWSVIEEIVSDFGLIAWSSADGRELFVGRPNYSQAPQFLIAHPKPGSSTKSTCIDLRIEEDNTDRYSMIVVTGGSGSSDGSNYGENVSSRRGKVVDGSGKDGVGRDFILPKRLLIPEQSLESNKTAQDVAERERDRRDFRRHVISATMPLHGQFVSTAAATLFAPNTITRVVDEELEPTLDDKYLITSCTYEADRESETTELELVPVGTEIIL